MTTQISPRQKRRIIIDLAQRRQKKGTGSSPEFMQRRTATIEWPDLRDTLQDIDWMLVGDVATRAYMPERMTNDMDIVIREQDAKQVTLRLQAAGWKIGHELSIGGRIFQSPQGIELDVLYRHDEWLEEAFAALHHDPAGYPVIGLPWLVLMKLQSSRIVDVGDVSKMLGWNSSEEIDAVRDVIARWSPEDSADLESMIMLGRLERDE